MKHYRASHAKPQQSNGNPILRPVSCARYCISRNSGRLGFSAARLDQMPRWCVLVAKRSLCGCRAMPSRQRSSKPVMFLGFHAWSKILHSVSGKPPNASSASGRSLDLATSSAGTGDRKTHEALAEHGSMSGDSGPSSGHHGVYLGSPAAVGVDETLQRNFC